MTGPNRRTRRRAASLFAVGLAPAVLCARPVAAQTTAQGGPPPAEGDAVLLPPESAIPPPVDNSFVQYGVAFTTEIVASAGPMCSASPTAPCAFGSGGGIVVPRIGWRSSGAWYVGGAYEMTKQDAHTIYQLPILQQLRGEARYYFLRGQILTPFVGGSAGIALYGNEWLTIDTFGPTGAATVGVEAQVSRGIVVGLALDYRLIYFKPFVDSSNTAREGSLAQLVGIDLQLEARDPL